MRIPNDHGYFVPFKEGKVWTDGFETLQFEPTVQPSDTITLEKVTMVGDDDHLKIIGVLLAGKTREVGSIQTLPRYPPQDKSLGPLIPAEGANIGGPGANFELLIGMKVIKGGFSVRKGINIDYSVNGKKHRAYFPATIVVCPRPLTSDQCSTKAGV